MARRLNAAVAQLGPIHLADSRAAVVQRLGPESFEQLLATLEALNPDAGLDWLPPAIRDAVALRIG